MFSSGTKNGNNDCIGKEVLRACQEEGCEIEFIRAMNSSISSTAPGASRGVKMLMSGTKNMCIHKDDFDWLAFEMFNADGVIMVDPIFETGASGLFHTVMAASGRAWTPVTTSSAPRSRRAVWLRAAMRRRASSVPDPATTSPKVVSYIGIGGSDWGTHVQSETNQAMTPSWKVIDNEWVPWSKTALMEDALISARIDRC